MTMAKHSAARPDNDAEEGTDQRLGPSRLSRYRCQGFRHRWLGAPPVFEAEWIQDGGSTILVNDYQTYDADIDQNMLAPVWDRQKLYSLGSGGFYLYSIPAERQYFNFDVSLTSQNYLRHLRYSETLDRIVYLSSFASLTYTGRSYDGSTGEAKAVSSVTADHTLGACLQDVGNTRALFVAFTSTAQIYCYLLDTSSFPTETFEQVYASGDAWNGYSDVQCVTPGGVSSGAVFYFCADADLVKVTFNNSGLLIGSTVVATLPHALRYAVYDAGDVVVWTDAGTVSRVDVATGGIEYTKTVPYQIDVAATRSIGDPDLQRLTEELFFQGVGTCYFTDLGTGVTRTVAGGLTEFTTYFYDGQTETVIAPKLHSTSITPRSLKFVVGDGDDRLLADFLTDLMVYGGGYDLSDIDVENVDDLIQGAVVDITAGARDIARSVIEPYSIAMFER
jgi:hypothetical protein